MTEPEVSARAPLASDAGKGQSPILPRKELWPWLTMLAVTAATVVALRFQGRLWWCVCGRWSFWSGDIWSSHNSQHPLDPYSFTHVLHGLAFCGLLAWAFPKLPLAWRFCLAIAIESLWEVFENSEFTIDRYRTMTVALDYRGDSIVNSLGDLLCCGLGFALAGRLGFRASLALFLATEAVLLCWIRDDLLLNIVMLVYPIDAIKAWQMGL